MPLDQFTQVQKAIIARFGSDPIVHDLSRVMRMPGFWHQKGTPFLSRIVQVHERMPYPADTILAEFPPVAARPQANGGDDGRDTGAEPLAELVRKILTGESYHGPLCSLAWRHLHDGMHPGKVVLTLRGYMDASPDPGTTAGRHATTTSQGSSARRKTSNRRRTPPILPGWPRSTPGSRPIASSGLPSRHAPPRANTPPACSAPWSTTANSAARPFPQAWQLVVWSC